MNFVKSSKDQKPRLIKHGDLVIIYERHDSLDHLYVHKGKIYSNRFGTFYHDDMINRPFGIKVKSRSTDGWVYILEPNPELWSTALHTRTQIVNETDSSVIALLLDVHPGCRVVESGTGSGCMTLTLARAVQPNGKVYTFEYNSVRATTAADEFRKLGVAKLVNVACRDVCGKYDTETEGGFLKDKEVTEGSIDAVFLDLPEPWLALDHAKKVLKPGKNICCYSPCIEQVMKTCEKLRALNFHSIRMIEVRQRPYDGRVIDLETLDLGLTPEEQELSEKSTRDPNLEHYHSKESKSIEAEITEVLESQSKRQKLDRHRASDNNINNDEAKEGKHDAEEMEGEGDEEIDEEKFQQQLSNRIRNRPKSSVNGIYQMHSGRPIFTMKGHTAFLTFAIRSFS